jgi:hypothetical protein
MYMDESKRTGIFLLGQRPKNIADHDAASHKILIGFRNQPVAFIFSDCEVEGTFDSFSFCRGLKQLLCTFEFYGIKPEVFVNDAVLPGRHNSAPRLQSSRNVHKMKMSEHTRIVLSVNPAGCL